MAGQNAALVRRWFEEVWNQGRMETVDELLAPDAVLNTEPGLTFKGPADFKAFFDKIRATFSNMRLEVKETIEEGDRVAVRWVVKLTHSGGHWAGIAPQNKDAEVSGISIAHIRNGRIVAGWDNWDAAGLTQQLHADGADIAAKPPQRNAPLLHRWFDELWNQGRLDVIDELLAPDAHLHAAHAVLVGPADFRAFSQMVHATFSNFHMDIAQTLEEGDMVTLRWKASMCHSGQPWAGIAPQNRDCAVTGITICQFRDGKIVAGWENWDVAGLVRQLQAEV
jgi:steroid delta-isomerase-like uncharacterized protein